MTVRISYTWLDFILFDQMSNIRVKFGERLKQLRQDRGLSQEELAKKAGLHRTTAGKIERAKTGVSLDTIERLADVLRIDEKELFDF